MCGITGLVLGRKVRSASDIANIKKSFIDTLIAAESRGTDAAGIFVLNEAGEHYFYRAPIKASELVKTQSFWDVLEQVGKSTIAIVGHTRAATTGAPEVIDNNHPIYDPPLVGVHNGVVQNHLELRKKYGAVADVDSATILSVLNAHISDTQTLTRKIIAKAMPEVLGSWAIAIADTRKDTLYLARNAGSPMQLTWQKSKQLMWFASTDFILRPVTGKQVKSLSMTSNSVIALTRDNAETGQTFYIGIKAPVAVLSNRYHYPKHQTHVYVPQNKPYKHDRQWKYPPFFDDGATTAAILKYFKEN